MTAAPNVVSRETLLQAAQECIAEKGIAKTTLKAVADKANVSQGTVYYHFRTKDQLMGELVQGLCDEMWNDIQSGNGTLEDALKVAQERINSGQFYNRLFFTMLVSSFQSEEHRNKLNQLIQQENTYVNEKLASYWNSTSPPSIPFESLAILINSMIDGIAVQSLLHEDFQSEKAFKAMHQLIQLALEEKKDD